MKKKKKFVDLDSKYYNIEKNPLEITKTIKKNKKIEGNVVLMTLPNISFFVMQNYIHFYWGSDFSIYNKEDFELIQIFTIIYSVKWIEIMNENEIILYYHYQMEIWTKNERNLFIKSKLITIYDIDPNFLIHSKLNLLISKYNYRISVWNIKENIPQNIITSIKLPNVHIFDLVFLNNEDLLGVNLLHYNYRCYFIYFLRMKDFSIVNKINISERVGKDFDFNKFQFSTKINENKIFCSYNKDYENKTFYVIIKIPEFKIEKKGIENCNFNIIVYKNYFLFYSLDRNIKVFESSKCNFVKEINAKGFLSIINLKDNYLLGIKREYVFEKDFKSLVEFKINL